MLGQTLAQGPLAHLDGLAVRLPSKIKDREDLLLLWQWHRQIEEWVKSDRDLWTQRWYLRGCRTGCSRP